jgi:hypothetical protein
MRFSFMKKPLTFLSFLLVTVGALAQGQVNFAARVAGVYDAPVFLCGVGGPKVEGNRYLVQLYAGATQTALAPVGNPLPFLTGADAGYWNAEAVTINTVGATGLAFAQVRVWDTEVASNYETAIATGTGFGASNIIGVKPTVTPDLPATLVGLQSFSFALPIGGNSCVPEPSIVLLAVLGSVPFLLRRQSNRR